MNTTPTHRVPSDVNDAVPRARVLALDDDVVDLRTLERHLSRINEPKCTFVGFNRLADAQNYLLSNEVDVMILDYCLEGLTGADAMKALRPLAPFVPVVFLTGRSEIELAVQLMQMGALDFMEKGILSTNSLERSLRTCLREASLQRQVRLDRAQIDEMNECLQRQNREIQSFYHTMAHELRTPLTAASEFTTILLDEIVGTLNEKQIEFLQIIKESCSQMAVQISDLLDTARIETGKLVLDLRPTEAKSFAERVISTLRHRALRENQSLTFHADEDLPRVMVDQLRMTQVLTNLVGNAVAYTPSGGRIHVAVERDADVADGVRYSVCDTGRGIAENDLPRIFDRLYQVEDGDTPSRAGLGLGLHLCRELVALHGGELQVTSRIGSGSTFRFTLSGCEASCSIR